MQDELEQLRLENARLKEYIASLSDNGTKHSSSQCAGVNAWDGIGHGLSPDQIARYSRQIILPSFGVQAQAKLYRGSVLIIGAGGLGSPAAIYLAAAGVGRIGIVDRDAVEPSNLHRQVIHTEARVGSQKTDSAASAIKLLNSSVVVETYNEGFHPGNALHLVSRYDVVLDASDNAPTRYLISDACVLAQKPLVSGAAIGTDGQLTVYCCGVDGPCYRCLFPDPPPPQNCARCVDAGVLGVVPGIIGTLQALEAIKILSGVGQPMSRKLLVMDALTARFHVVKLRAKSPACVACGGDSISKLTKETIEDYDYAAFTGQVQNDGPLPPLRLLDPSDRCTCEQLQTRLLGGNQNWLLIDVRPPEQFAICHLPGALNAPWKKFNSYYGRIEAKLASCANEIKKDSNEERPAVFVMCRRGNDSQRAVARLRELGVGHAVDVVGGIECWARTVDPSFPMY